MYISIDLTRFRVTNDTLGSRVPLFGQHGNGGGEVGHLPVEGN